MFIVLVYYMATAYTTTYVTLILVAHLQQRVLQQHVIMELYE